MTLGLVVVGEERSKLPPESKWRVLNEAYDVLFEAVPIVCIEAAELVAEEGGAGPDEKRGPEEALTVNDETEAVEPLDVELEEDEFKEAALRPLALREVEDKGPDTDVVG